MHFTHAQNLEYCHASSRRNARGSPGSRRPHAVRQTLYSRMMGQRVGPKIRSWKHALSRAWKVPLTAGLEPVGLRISWWSQSCPLKTRTADTLLKFARKNGGSPWEPSKTIIPSEGTCMATTRRIWRARRRRTSPWVRCCKHSWNRADRRTECFRLCPIEGCAVGRGWSPRMQIVEVLVFTSTAGTPTANFGNSTERWSRTPSRSKVSFSPAKFSPVPVVLS